VLNGVGLVLNGPRIGASRSGGAVALAPHQETSRLPRASTTDGPDASAVSIATWRPAADLEGNQFQLARDHPAGVHYSKRFPALSAGHRVGHGSCPARHPPALGARPHILLKEFDLPTLGRPRITIWGRLAITWDGAQGRLIKMMCYAVNSWVGDELGLPAAEPPGTTHRLLVADVSSRVSASPNRSLAVAHLDSVCRIARVMVSLSTKLPEKVPLRTRLRAPGLAGPSPSTV